MLPCESEMPREMAIFGSFGLGPVPGNRPERTGTAFPYFCEIWPDEFARRQPP
jgi:hypothetical protein